jgi:hypothetical protein
MLFLVSCVCLLYANCLVFLAVQKCRYFFPKRKKGNSLVECNSGIVFCIRPVAFFQCLSIYLLTCLWKYRYRYALLSSVIINSYTSVKTQSPTPGETFGRKNIALENSEISSLELFLCIRLWASCNPVSSCCGPLVTSCGLHQLAGGDVEPPRLPGLLETLVIH